MSSNKRFQKPISTLSRGDNAEKKMPKSASIMQSRPLQQPQQIEDDFRVEKTVDGQEIFVFDPYNPLNRLITEPEIRQILQKYGIDAPIHNYQLYKRAFIHQSYLKRPAAENAQNNVVIVPKPEGCLDLFTKSNERMEFLGDGVLECIAKYILYRRFPKENEGFMTEKKIALVKNEAIGKIALEMGLNKWMVLSKNAEQKQTRTNLKKLGCLFEAFIGAIFLDFNKIEVKDEAGWFQNTFITGPGFQMAQIFIENVFEKHVDWMALVMNDDNYKNILQVRIQKEFKLTPEYLDISSPCTGGSEDHGYKMGVFLCIGQSIHTVSKSTALPIDRFSSFTDIHQHISMHGKVLILLGEGGHKIKKKAEQMACSTAIHALREF